MKHMIHTGRLSKNFALRESELTTPKFQDQFCLPVEAFSKYREQGFLNEYRLAESMNHYPQHERLIECYLRNIEEHGDIGIAHLLLSQPAFDMFSRGGTIPKLELYLTRQMSRQFQWMEPLSQALEAVLKLEMWRLEVERGFKKKTT